MGCQGHGAKDEFISYLEEQVSLEYQDKFDYSNYMTID